MSRPATRPVAEAGRYSVGVDLGKTRLRGVVLDRQGRIRFRRERPSPAALGPRATYDAIRALCSELGSRVDDPGAPVGVASFGVIDPSDGSIASGGRVPGWTGVPLAARLSRDLHQPVCVENDAHAAARGEFILGAARGWSSAVYLSLSTGVALSYVDGAGVRWGAHGLAGQIARARLGPERGTLSRSLSGSGLAFRASTLAGRRVASPSVYRAGRDGAGWALAALRTQQEALALTLTWAQILCDPQGIVLGGSVAREHPEILRPLRVRMRAYLEYYGDVLPKGPTLRIERLEGWAGAVGAALGASRGPTGRSSSAC